MGTPATVVIDELTGSSPDVQAVTKVRLFSADVATNQVTPQTTNSVVIPAAGYNYSYWKAVCLEITAGSGYSVTNITHKSAGDIAWAFGSGGQLRRGNRDAGDHGCPDVSYQQAGGVAGTTGYAIEDATGVQGHAYYKAQTTPTADVNADTVAIVIDSGTYTSTGRTNHIVLQVKVDTVANGAVQGTQTAKTLTWAYDES